MLGTNSHHHCRTWRRRGCCVRVTTKVAGSIGGPYVIAIRGRSQQAAVAESGTGRCANLREARAAASLAALDLVTSHSDVVGRCGPGQINRRTGSAVAARLADAVGGVVSALLLLPDPTQPVRVPTVSNKTVAITATRVSFFVSRGTVDVAKIIRNPPRSVIGNGRFRSFRPSREAAVLKLRVVERGSVQGKISERAS
jgi:hypothetical protein